MRKIVFFAFQEDPLCFIHVLLNALDLARQGREGKIILEGKAVQLVELMAQPSHFLHQLYRQAKEEGLFLGACRACSLKLGASEAVAAEQIPLIGELSGHPAMSFYLAQGYEVLTF
jgi:hypothetical protein